MKKEIEIKLRVDNLPALRRRLRKLGARMGKRLHESNRIFDTPDGQLRREDKLLRLRTTAGACLITFKGRSLPGPRGLGKYKVRQETEFSVPDFAAMAEMIRMLGLRETFRYEKYRTDIHLPGSSRAHICLDETPLGAFLEIEGGPASIDRAARRLGYAAGDYMTKSYLALWAEHCRRQGLPFGNFLFMHEKKSKKTSVLR